MAQIEIPKAWREKVCAILETEATDRLIEWTTDAERRYEADATAAKIRAGNIEPVWRYEVYGLFREFLLSPHPTGCCISMETPPGETYEFNFDFLGERFYGKILLRPDRKQVVIFSAHRAMRSKLSCE
jgi:hypothetical protein